MLVKAVGYSKSINLFRFIASYKTAIYNTGRELIYIMLYQRNKYWQTLIEEAPLAVFYILKRG